MYSPKGIVSQCENGYETSKPVGLDLTTAPNVFFSILTDENEDIDVGFSYIHIRHKKAQKVNSL